MEGTATMTYAEAADLLNCSEAMVRRFVGRGRLPAFRFAGAWRVDRQALIDEICRLCDEWDSTHGGTA
jgi:excisionase family DNA binding protein